MLSFCDIVITKREWPVDNLFFKIKDQTARRGAERVLLAVFCVFVALLIAVGAGASTLLPAFAAEFTAYDRSGIEDDLRDVDISAYPADENGRHFLMDDVGFMEYGYSESSFIVDNYFGIYLYVYNPTEREVSTRAGANVVNMATAYDAEGEPTNYENVPITVLDCTDNHRFYKFRITDGAAVYERAHAYAQAHGGVRRYDIAGIQLWFTGDQNATDSFTERGEKSVTYRCTGYAAGCGEDNNEESTLDIERDKLESVELDVQHTFWRTQTSSLGAGHQNQLDTVYFTVPQRFFDEYGELQRILAEWWEYKTKPLLVTSNMDWYNGVIDYMGTPLPQHGTQYYDENLVYAFGVGHNDLIGGAGVSYEGTSWNINATRDVNIHPGDPMQTLYLLFNTDGASISSYDPKADIVSSGGVSTNALEEYIFGYDNTFDSGTLNIKDGQVISADLFEEDIDESRKVDNERGKIQMGYSYYDFDVSEDVQEIVSWADGDPSWWDNWNEFGFWESLFGNIPEEAGRSFAPIYIPKEEDFAGTAEEIADRLMCQVSDVERLRAAYETEDEVLVLFRFATSDYYAEEADLIDYSQSSFGNARIRQGEAYIAQESVFLNFDVIQLTFNDSGDMTIIPVVANPIDIIDPITPPPDFSNENYWTLVWWLVGIALGSVVVGVVGGIIEIKSK